MDFKEKLDKVVEKNNSLLCVGLDTEIEKIPQKIKSKKEAIFEFNKAIIDATAHLVCAYKPNIAFYEACGLEGLSQLKKTIGYLKNKHLNIPIVLDAKRADIGNTAKMYAKSVFDYWEADAATVYPNLGLDSLEPFLNYKDKLSILLIRTSNPDSKMFQSLKLNGEPYYLRMAREIKNWDYPNFGIFVGATYPKELAQIRGIFPDRIFLSAGFGAQNAQIKKAVLAGVDKNKKSIMFNASRSIIYTSQSGDFDRKASEEAEKLRNLINSFRGVS